MSYTIVRQDFRIVFILFILILTVVFCHSLIRMCMLALRSRKRHRTQRLGRAGTGGFAEVHQPIRVMTERDVEMALEGYHDDEAKNLPPPPPAYGLWRGSVVSACNDPQRM